LALVVRSDNTVWRIAMRRRDVLKLCATMAAASAVRPVGAQSDIVTRAAVVIGVDKRHR
jgi:hypothetical protein